MADGGSLRRRVREKFCGLSGRQILFGCQFRFIGESACVHGVEQLEANGIQTRMLFAGNLVKHPCFDEMRKTGEGYRVVESLDNTERIMRDTFWIGVYSGMTDEKIDYMIEKIRGAVR